MSSKTSSSHKSASRRQKKLEQTLMAAINLEVTELQRPQVTISVHNVNLFVKKYVSTSSDFQLTHPY